MYEPSYILCLLIGAVIAFFTWQAYGSGEMRLQIWTLRRDGSPTTFQGVLILRALLGVLCAVASVWGILGGAQHG
jgi:hypothetical protein